MLKLSAYIRIGVDMKIPYIYKVQAQILYDCFIRSQLNDHSDIY